MSQHEAFMLQANLARHNPPNTAMLINIKQHDLLSPWFGVALCLYNLCFFTMMRFQQVPERAQKVQPFAICCPRTILQLELYHQHNTSCNTILAIPPSCSMQLLCRHLCNRKCFLVGMFHFPPPRKVYSTTVS